MMMIKDENIEGWEWGSMKMRKDKDEEGCG